jgi:endonuclease/exonuclease/phosphatase family metal-dependent hydrolase
MRHSKIYDWLKLLWKMNLSVTVLLVILSFVTCETSVYLQNNSEYTLTFKSFTQTGTGGNLPRDKWNHIPTTQEIQPGERIKITWFSRNSGITNGKNFIFSQTLTLPWDQSKEIVLQQHVTGTLTHSTMKHKVAGIFETPWTTDRRIQNVQLQAERFHLVYRSYFKIGSDDMEYVFFKAADFSSPKQQDSDKTLRIMAYNVYMRYPRAFFLDGQLARAQIFPIEIKRAFEGDKIDLFVFSEAFDPESRTSLINGLKLLGFHHYTPNVGQRGTIKQDGGVFIMSKFPIVSNSSVVFLDCSGTDCLAEKGVVYAKIKKNENIYHVFGTHTQAWWNNHDIRVKQIKQIIEFKNSLKLPKNEPVIYAGDLNVDMVRFPDQEEEMRRILNAESSKTTGPLKYTFDPVINQLAQSEDKSKKVQEILDYVYYSKDHLKPNENGKSFVKTFLMRSLNPWKATAVSKDNWECSDHFPVYSFLDFN